MEPTLRSGNLSIISKHNTSYNLGDIIVFKTDGYGTCIKRIIGKGGDTFTLENNEVKRNGTILSNYTFKVKKTEKYVLEDNQYFAIGDNYNDSIDSRDYGPIDESQIVGKII